MNSSNQKSPLRWFLLLLLGLVYIQSLQAAMQNLNPTTKVPLPGTVNSPQLDLVSFTVLMAVQGGLLWIAFSLHKTRDLLLSFLAQGILVLLISFLAQAENATLGLCLALTIEAITLFKQTRLVLLVGGGCLLLFGLTEGAQIVPVIETGSMNKLSDAIIGSLTLILFVIACVMLYIQQGRAHQRDQAFLRELETAHAELKTAHGQLEEYAIQVEDLTLIAERQRLARELHDTLAQGLVGLTMQLETIDALLLKQHCQQARTIVQQAMTRARATMTEARSAIEDLRTETLETYDFPQAVQREIQRFTAATGIPCTCSLPETLPLPTSFHEHLLRLVTEGLLNIARHARATHVWVCATFDQERLTFEIGDDGIGFDPAVVAQQVGHYGLLGLRERARLLQGQLSILSTAGKGTTICLQLPRMNGGMSDEREVIRVVVVDDHLVVREGLRMMLELAGEGFALVGDAADGTTALHVVEELQPDVVLMDLRMQGMDGLEAIAHIRKTWPQIAVVILTTYNEDDLMLRGLRSGACGYLLKDTNRETLFHAIRAAARREMLLQPEMMARVLALTSQAKDATLSFDSAEGMELTEREREILQGVAHGERSKEIAARLGISIRTVGAHLASIYTKLGVDSRASAVAMALERGLLDHDRRGQK